MVTLEKRIGGPRIGDKGARFYLGDGHQYEKAVLDECRTEDSEYIRKAIEFKTDIDPRFSDDLQELNKLQGDERQRETKRITKFLLRKIENKPRYVQDILFQRALDLAKQFQPIDEGESVELNNPQKPFLAELRMEIIDDLGLKGEDCDRLKVFTTVGTDADYLFGTDAVVEFGEKKDKDYKIITLDLTLRKEKLGKADIIFDREVKSVDNPEEEDEFWEVVEDISKKICKKILVG